MKILISLVLIFTIQMSFSQKFNFNNDELLIPEWIINPNYGAELEAESESLSIYVDNTFLGKLNGYNVYAFIRSESEYNSGTTDVEFASFDSNMKIVDCTNTYTSCSTSDWNNCSFNFETIEPYGFALVTYRTDYRPADFEDDEYYTGGIVISNQDTTYDYFMVTADGKINSSDLAELEDIRPKTDEDKVVEIRGWFNDINAKQKSYNEIKKEVDLTRDIICWYDGSELKKMSVITQVETDKITEDFYFRCNELFFLYRTVTGKNKDESRYYFWDNEMFRYLVGSEKKNIQKNTRIFKDTNTEVNALQKEYQNIFKKLK